MVIRKIKFVMIAHIHIRRTKEISLLSINFPLAHVKSRECKKKHVSVHVKFFHKEFYFESQGGKLRSAKEFSLSIRNPPL